MSHKVRRNFRFYPSKEQALLLERTFGCVRLVYNKALAFRQEKYAEGEPSGFKESNASLTSLKKEKEFFFLNEVSCVPLQQSLRHLQSAYTRFFKKLAGFPRFKSKTHAQSAEFTRSAFKFENGELYLAKIGRLNVKWSMKIDNPSTVTVIKTASGKYFISLVLEESINVLPQTNSKIGIDLGVETFATLSTGEKVSQPATIRLMRKKLARVQRQLSRKKKGSKRREKARIKVAKLHERVSNVRKDFLHKLSTKIVRENQTICLEDLAVSNMVKNRKLSRCISEQGWQTFRNMLAYKCEWYGRELRTVNRWFASSKTCSCCNVKIEKLPLNVRVWTCPTCGSVHDRDTNAAKNILAAGQAVSARGETVRPPQNESFEIGKPRRNANQTKRNYALRR